MKKLRFTRWAMGFVTVVAVGVLTGCGEADDSPAASAARTVSNDPVTITATLDGTRVDDNLLALINEMLKKKHPNIRFQYEAPGAGVTLDSMLAGGSVPDILFTYNGRVSSYKDKDLLYDITPLIKQLDVDTNRFNPQYWGDVKNLSDKGEIFGLPIYAKYHAMYYNKDIYGKFGVSYPTDGMTMSQLVELARKVTRMDGGTQYRGLDPGNLLWISQPLAAVAIDPLTNKAAMNNGKWKEVFELVKSIYDIPGNGKIKPTPKDQFLKDKTLATLLDLNILDELGIAGKEGLNWDLAQYPSYPEKPNTYGNASVDMMLITKTSKHKEQAMQVINVVTSDELQQARSKQGIISSLADAKIREAFGTGLEFTKEKNLQGIFKSNPVTYPAPSEFRQKAEAFTNKYFNEYLAGNMDVNTALKKADDDINKMVATELSK